MPDEEIPDEIQPEQIPLTPVARQERIAAMDVLRGLAVFGIFLINMPLYLAPLDAFFNWENNALWSDPADRLTTAFLYIFAQGKFYTLFSFLFGLGFGVATIARPVLLAERYDLRRYATLAGTMLVPMTIAKALAPLGAATLHSSTHSYAPVLTGIALCCAIAATAIAATAPTSDRSSLSDSA